jgi:F0F1-type ATP synthase assembly protein I
MSENGGRKRNGEDKQDENPYRLAHLGMQLGLTFLLFFFFGYWLDNRLGTLPWLTIVFILLGFTGGMILLIRAASREE